MASKTMAKDLSTMLPSAWTNVIASTTDKTVTVRSNIVNMEDINDWVLDFGRKSQTRWNARMCHPSKQKFVCSKEFICHHSNYNKRTQATSVGKKPTKNTHCQARIKAKIKLYTQNTRYTDPFVLKRLCGVIVIELEHTHFLGTPESLRWLPADYKIKDMFLGYYKSGKRIAESCHYHERILTAQPECDKEGWLEDRRINPNQRIVRSWHDQWRMMNVPIEKPNEPTVVRPKRKRRKLSPFRPSSEDAVENNVTDLEPTRCKQKKRIRGNKPTRVIQNASSTISKDVTEKVQHEESTGNCVEDLNLNNNQQKTVQNCDRNSENRVRNSSGEKDIDNNSSRIDLTEVEPQMEYTQRNNACDRTIENVFVLESDATRERANINEDKTVGDSDHELDSGNSGQARELEWQDFIKLVVQKLKKVDGQISRRTVKEKFNDILTVALSGGYESRYSWLDEFED